MIQKTKEWVYYIYCMWGRESLEDSDCEKDHGILIQNKFSCGRHFRENFIAVYALLANIRLALRSWLEMYLQKIHFFMRPKLEYGVSLSNPCLENHVQRLEWVQKCLTTMVPELVSLGNEERLKILQFL